MITGDSFDTSGIQNSDMHTESLDNSEKETQRNTHWKLMLVNSISNNKYLRNSYFHMQILN